MQVHHLIFLLPHAVGERREKQHSDHAGPERENLPPPQHRNDLAVASRPSFSTGSLEDNLDSEESDMAHQEFWELRTTPDVLPPQHDEIVSASCTVANVCGMLCVSLVPYCVNGTVTWKGLPHAATFPVFCLGIIVAVYASMMFIVLRYVPGDDVVARQQARQSLWLLCATAALLCVLAVLTDGSWSIDAIVLVSP